MVAATFRLTESVGLGLLRIRERVELPRGRMTIKRVGSRNGDGTTASINPLSLGAGDRLHGCSSASATSFSMLAAQQLRHDDVDALEQVRGPGGWSPAKRSIY